MNRIFITLLFLLTVGTTYGGDSLLVDNMANGILQIRQKPGSDRLLAEYLSPLKSKSDTIYAIIYIPTYCRRCEVVISSLYNALKQVDSTNEVLLISAYKDAEMAERYNRKNGYKADLYLYDTDSRYENIFSFNMNGMYGAFILKMCKSSGRLIIGGDPELIDEDFARRLSAFDEALPFHAFTSNGVSDMERFSAPEPSFGLMDVSRYTDYQMHTDKDHPLSGVSDRPSFEDSTFFYKDELEEGVMVFRQNGEELSYSGLLQVDSTEKSRFVNIPANIYNGLIASKQIFYIPIYASMSQDRKWIGISYSLPDLEMRTTADGNRVISYYNATVVVNRDVRNLKPGPMQSVDFDTDNSDFFYAHFRYKDIGNKTVFGCKKKAWPMDVPVSKYRGVTSMDPFMNEFYDTGNPFMAAFDKTTGKLLYQFGRLADCAAASRTGYAFTNPVYDVRNNELAYADGCSGMIYVADSSDLRKTKESYRLFSVDSGNFPLPDSSAFYKEEYAKAYNRFFYRTIENIIIKDNFIYCIVRYGMPHDTDEKKTNDYVFAVIDRKKGTVVQKRIPKYKDANVMGYGIRNQSESICQPFIFIKRDGHYFIRVFDFDTSSDVYTTTAATATATLTQ